MMPAEFEQNPTLTNYWLALNQDLETLCNNHGQFSSNDYVIAAREMIKEGRKFESAWTVSLPGIASNLARAEEKLGHEIGNDANGDKHFVPEINSAESFYFSLVYFRHMQRFDNVVSSSNLLQSGALGKKGIMENKPFFVDYTNEFKNLIQAYWNENAVQIAQEFPDLNPQVFIPVLEQMLVVSEQNDQLDDEIEGDIEIQEPAVIDDETLSSDLTESIAEQVEQIISESHGNIEQAIGSLNNYFDAIIQSSENLYRVKQLELALAEENSQFDTLTASENWTHFIADTHGDSGEWRDKLHSINTDVNAHINQQRQQEHSQQMAEERRRLAQSREYEKMRHLTLQHRLQQPNRHMRPLVKSVSSLWQWSKSVVEGGGRYLNFGFIPQVLKSPIQKVYTNSTHFLEKNATNLFGSVQELQSMNNESVIQPQTLPVIDDANSLKKERLKTFYDERINAYANNLRENFPNNENLADRFKRANSNNIQQLKQKVEIMKELLVMDQQLEQYIEQHNKGLVKFNDFFRPITRFLRHTFMKPVIHDVNLLLEEARDLKKELIQLKENLESEQETTNVSAMLQQQRNDFSKRVTDVPAESNYVFFPADKQRAREKATELNTIVAPPAA